MRHLEIASLGGVWDSLPGKSAKRHLPPRLLHLRYGTGPGLLRANAHAAELGLVHVKLARCDRQRPAGAEHAPFVVDGVRGSGRVQHGRVRGAA
jgi:hypothetical protein